MDYSSAVLVELMVHYAGVREREEPLLLTKRPVAVSQAMQSELRDFFLRRFDFAYEQYRFTEESEALPSIREIFQDPDSLTAASGTLATLLHEAISHPKVKPAEVVVARFTHVPYEDQLVDAIGIFKMENRTRFLELDAEKSGGNTSYSFSIREGIDLVKADKSCLILDVLGDDGYMVKITDPHSRGAETAYWREQFLGLKQRSTDYSKTRSVMATTREFVSDTLSKEFQMEPAQKAELLNRSVEWFQDRDTFDRTAFEQDVFKDPEVIESYRRFSKEKMGTEEVEDDSFALSLPAVKKQARIFKSVLKLDRNFHIYIHGNRELIQRCEEPDGRKYYKIYFSEES